MGLFKNLPFSNVIENPLHVWFLSKMIYLVISVALVNDEGIILVEYFKCELENVVYTGTQSGNKCTDNEN